MIDIDKWNEIFSALKKNKLRTFLTAFGVFWGIFMLVIMLGSGNGLENAVFYNMGDFATNSCFMYTRETSIPYKGFPRGRRFNFTNSDTKALRQQIQKIKYLSPRLRDESGTEGDNAVRGNKAGAFSIMGDAPDWNKIDPVNITAGRYLNEIDILEKRKVIVIGKTVVNELFKTGENPIGQTIRISGIYFTVVGTFKSKKSGQRAENEEQNIHMPYTTLQRIYNYGDVVGWYGIVTYDNVPVSYVEEKSKQILKKRHAVHPDDDRAIGSDNVEEEFKKLHGLFFGISTLIWIVGIGTLMAGVIGVSNIMLVIVKERTKEIGIQRALGAKPVEIIRQIINEAVFLTSVAGCIGLAAGVWLIELINKAIGEGGDMFRNPEVNFNIAVVALVVLIISGAFAGMLPATRAVRVKPIDAIRDE